MDVEIRHAPSFGVARCRLRASEAVKVEAGAMMAHSVGMALEAKIEGGVLKGLKRSVLGGESLFMSTFTAPAQGGWVDVAAKLPGDLRVIELDGSQSWIVERGNWLASDAAVDIDAKWSGFKSLVGGEGGFMVHAEGVGKLLVASYGAIDVISLGAGETVVVDTNHMLAFPDTVTFELRRAVEGRSIQSMKSGEGLVFHFTGPGDILTQTRNQQQLIAWINTEIGSRE
ncbi:TIGR00266 family protein [Candidatus Poriferisocius sp.]|uniref:TIGR00266 family protein n=1 Tax=Candidatus Poriferisocius sp. TaxID=3101276 RepID=UPI003B5A4898